MNTSGGWKQKLVLVAVAAALSACGGGSNGDGLNGEQQQVADGIAEGIGQSGIVDQEQAQCWADGLVKSIGVDRLKEFGFTAQSTPNFDTLKPLGVTREEAEQFTNGLFECADPSKIVEDEIAKQVGPEIASCVMGKVDDSTLKAMLSAQYYDGVQSTEDQEVILTAVTDCSTG